MIGGTASRRLGRAVRAAFGLAAAVLPLGVAAAEIVAPERFVVYYGQDAAPAEFAPYKRAVLDADHHPALSPLRARGIELFGYVSVGEADAARSYHAQVEAAGLLLGPNPNWPGARFVDLRKPAWQTFLLDRIIPGVVEQGFDGLFLDTLDDAAFLEQADPVRNGGMIEAAAGLVKAIHTRYPNLPLMLNRAYDVAALVSADLESILAESLASDYDFRHRRYGIRSAADLRWGLARLAELRALNPALHIYTLDYWSPTDKAGIARLYEQQRRAGFVPYVATVDLQRIVPEPNGGGGRR